MLGGDIDVRTGDVTYLTVSGVKILRSNGMVLDRLGRGQALSIA